MSVRYPVFGATHPLLARALVLSQPWRKFILGDQPDATITVDPTPTPGTVADIAGTYSWDGFSFGAFDYLWCGDLKVAGRPENDGTNKFVWTIGKEGTGDSEGFFMTWTRTSGRYDVLMIATPYDHAVSWETGYTPEFMWDWKNGLPVGMYQSPYGVETPSLLGDGAPSGKLIAALNASALVEGVLTATFDLPGFRGAAGYTATVTLGGP
jgi:hypothetical protein